MKKQERAKVVLDNLNKFYPNIPIPLKHKNVYELLIAVLLSAQCTDERVNKITPLLFKTANNPHDMAKLPVNKIYKIIKPCGLAPKKSKAISKLSKIYELFFISFNGETDCQLIKLGNKFVFVKLILFKYSKFGFLKNHLNLFLETKNSFSKKIDLLKSSDDITKEINFGILKKFSL